MTMRVGKPLARSEDLVTEEVEDEVLVYDAKNQRAHCLASAAAKVWRACDGTKDVSALAESLALSVDDVTRALEMLDEVELLENHGLQIVTNGRGGCCSSPDALFDRCTVSGRRGHADEPTVCALLHR